jgi:HEPN superfamily RES-like protein
MGRVKDWQIEQEERGWWSVPNKYVCADCFDDDYLKQVVKDNLAASACSYCGQTGEDATGETGALIAAPFDAVMEVVAEGIHSEWNSADDEGIPYESAEGGYQADTLDSYDLVWDLVCPNNDALAEDIIDALPDHAWVQRRYWSLSQDQALWYGWENFCETVKHRTRYMFQIHGRKRGPRESAGSDQAIATPSPNEGAPPAEMASPAEARDGAARPAEGAVVRFGIPFSPIPLTLTNPIWKRRGRQKKGCLPARSWTP